MAEVTNGMRVIAAEAIGFRGELSDVPQYALDAVIKVKDEMSKALGYEANLNKFFVQILDRVTERLF